MVLPHLNQQLSLVLWFTVGLAGWVCLRMAGLSFETTALIVTPFVVLGWWR